MISFSKFPNTVHGAREHWRRVLASSWTPPSQKFISFVPCSTHARIRYFGLLNSADFLLRCIYVFTVAIHKGYVCRCRGGGLPFPRQFRQRFAISGTSNTTVSGYLSASSLSVSFVCEETEGEATSVGERAAKYPDYPGVRLSEN